ncbi:hypothetical protein Tco_0477117, partial [Tanacetum coccineum]
ELIGRWTKDHQIANVIGDLSRLVFTRGAVDPTLFSRKAGNDLLLVQDVDDGADVILFRITNFSKS